MSEPTQKAGRPPVPGYATDLRQASNRIQSTRQFTHEDVRGLLCLVDHVLHEYNRMARALQRMAVYEPGVVHPYVARIRMRHAARRALPEQWRPEP